MSSDAEDVELKSVLKSFRADFQRRLDEALELAKKLRGCAISEFGTDFSLPSTSALNLDRNVDLSAHLKKAVAEDQLQRLSQRNLDLQERLRVNETINKALFELFGKLNFALDDSVRKVADAEEKRIRECQDIARKLETKNDEIQRKTELVKRLTDENVDLRTELASLRADVHSKDADAQVLEKQKDGFENELGKAKAEIRDFKEQLKEERVRCAKLESDYEKLQASKEDERRRFKEVHADMESQILALTRQLEIEKGSREKIVDQLQRDYETQMALKQAEAADNLKRQRDTERRALEASAQQYSELRKKYERVKNELSTKEKELWQRFYTEYQVQHQKGLDNLLRDRVLKDCATKGQSSGRNVAEMFLREHEGSEASIISTSSSSESANENRRPAKAPEQPTRKRRESLVGPAPAKQQRTGVTVVPTVFYQPTNPAKRPAFR